MEANRPEESREAILGAGLGVLFFLFIANVVFAVIGALGYEEGLTDFLGHMLMAAYAAIVLRLGFAERNYLVPGVLLLAAEAAAFVSVYVIRSSRPSSRKAGRAFRRPSASQRPQSGSPSCCPGRCLL